ncbi:hypothetical protein D3C73_1238940 [compost metagenome]
MRVCPRLFTTRHAPACDLAPDQFSNQLGGVSSTVAPHVHNQAVQCGLSIEVAVELRPAVGHHVRDVQVAELAVRCLTDGASVSPDPVLVPQPLLVTDGNYGNPSLLASRLTVAITVQERQLNGPAR